MFVGNIKDVDLGVSSFERLITDDSLFVDKSMFIEHFLDTRPSVQLIARQRRLGKSLNMDMLRSFLSDQQDYRPLFENLLIRKSHVWEMANSSPVFLLNLKGLDIDRYPWQIKDMLDAAIAPYLKRLDCDDVLTERYNSWKNDKIPVYEGILLLTQIVFAVTNKRSYILIDEYDKLIMDNLDSDLYDSILKFMTHLYMSGLKDNPCLAKALLTGVTRLSYEGLLSGLNNLKTYDVFMDNIYAEDYGITENEAQELSQAIGFDLYEARKWYNGIKIGGKPIYNMYAMMSMISDKTFKCYWGASGTMELIASIMGEGQRHVIMNLLEPGKKASVSIEERISPKQLRANCLDSMFYSLLVQAGYLALEKMERITGTVSIPNAELRDVWERFLLSNFFNLNNRMSSLFRNAGDPDQFASDLEAYLTGVLDTMSYHDLPTSKCADGKRRVPERDYHLLLYMVLTAGRDMFKYQAIRSNRESGDGRYDILVEFEDLAVIFEIKSAADDEDLEEAAKSALAQIQSKRYGVDIGKPITGIGCAFSKKNCRAAGGEPSVKA